MSTETPSKERVNEKRGGHGTTSRSDRERLEHSNTSSLRETESPKDRSHVDASGRDSAIRPNDLGGEAAAESESGSEGTSLIGLDEATCELRHDRDLLACVGAAMIERGYAGDVAPPQLAYLALTSRLLERPLNLAFVAPSATGKNRAVDAALELMPPGAAYVITAASPKVVIYTCADFQHRTVVFSEADSIPEEGPAGSAMRSLAADNKLVYEVVEKSKEGEHHTRRIEKEGPTGLITTSTRSLRHQMSTRVLEVSLDDDPEQTRAVMLGHAETVNPLGAATRKGVDLVPFIQLQEWLVTKGEHRVAVPFAKVLARLVPSTDVRMRRDFKQLLTAISAVALLYQCQRDRTPEGWIQASFEDYDLARGLLGPIFEALAAEGLTPAIRETVEAVPGRRAGLPFFISEAKLAEQLELAKSTISWRVTRAIAGGWIRNDERRKGQPAKLTRGRSLPDEDSTLPTVEQLRHAFESTFESTIRTLTRSDL